MVEYTVIAAIAVALIAVPIDGKNSAVALLLDSFFSFFNGTWAGLDTGFLEVFLPAFAAGVFAGADFFFVFGRIGVRGGKLRAYDML